jgi:hypothetical protein
MLTMPAQTTSQPPADRTARAGLVWLGLVASIVISFAAYWPALGNAFRDDDGLFLNLGREILADPLSILHVRPFGCFRPVWLAYCTTMWAAFDTHAVAYFAAAIVLHGVNGFLVWKLACRYLGMLAACASALTYILVVAHCESTLWYSAHNTSLASGLAVAALLLHCQAVERGGVARAALATLTLAAALGAKESAVTVLAWLPIAQLVGFGPRSFLSRRSIALLAAVAVLGAAYVWLNPRVLEGFRQHVPGTLGDSPWWVRVQRIVATYPWLYWPQPHSFGDPSISLGLAAIAASFALPWLVGGASARRATLLGVLLALTAIVPPATMPGQYATGSRIYDHAVVGAALVIGGQVAAVAGAPRGWRSLLAVVLISVACLHVRSIRRENAAFHRPSSLAQTRFATDLGALLPPDRRRSVIVVGPLFLNPPLGREFLAVFQGIPPLRIVGRPMPSENVAAWVERARKRDSTILVIESVPSARMFSWKIRRGAAPLLGPGPILRLVPPGTQPCVSSAFDTTLVVEIMPEDDPSVALQQLAFRLGRNPLRVSTQR